MQQREEAAAKMAKDAYKKQLESLYGLDTRGEGGRLSTPAPEVSTTSSSPTTTSSSPTTLISEDIPEGMSTPEDIREGTSVSEDFTTMMPTMATDESLMTFVPPFDDIESELTEAGSGQLPLEYPVTRPTILAEEEIYTITTPPVVVTTVEPSTVATIIYDYPPMRAASFATPTLEQLKEKYDKEWAVLFEMKVPDADPEDSRRLYKPTKWYPRRKQATTVPTPLATSGLDLLQKTVDDEKQSLLKDQLDETVAKKKEELALLAFEMAKQATPSTISVPKMSGFPEVLETPMATDPIFMVNATMGATKEADSFLVIDMRTERGMAMTAGLFAMGKKEFLLVLYLPFFYLLLPFFFFFLTFSF